MKKGYVTTEGESLIRDGDGRGLEEVKVAFGLGGWSFKNFLY